MFCMQSTTLGRSVTSMSLSSGPPRNGSTVKLEILEGIIFMKIKYKEAGMKFKCFHNRGIQNDGLLDNLQASMLQRGSSSFQRNCRVCWDVGAIYGRIDSGEEKMDVIVQRRDCQTAKAPIEDDGYNTAQRNLLR